LNTIIPWALLSAVCVLAWISVDRTASLIAVSFFYAFVSGGAMAFTPAIIVFLSPDLSKIGVRVGMALTVGLLGVLIGSPIAGVILKSQSGVDDKGDVIVGELNFSGVLVFTGVVLLFSSLSWPHKVFESGREASDCLRPGKYM
jgi:MFS family permease